MTRKEEGINQYIERLSRPEHWYERLIIKLDDAIQTFRRWMKAP